MRWTLAAVVLLSGCSYHLWSPPARVLPAEGVGQLAPEEVRVQAVGHAHAPLAVLDSRPVPAGGSGELAVGLGGGVDLRLTGQALALAGGGQASVDRAVWSGRGGLRWAPERWVALGVGLGAGAHAAGGFVAPDLGLTLGGGSERVGCFFDVRVGGSFPFDAKAVELTQPGDDERHFATPAPTLVLQLTPGLRVTLPTPEATGVSVVLRVSPSFAWLVDEEEDSGWLGGGLALEVGFGGPPARRSSDPPPTIRPLRSGPAPSPTGPR